MAAAKMGKKRARDEGGKKSVLEDWVAALARGEVSATGNTKAERIERRLAKRKRRDESKRERSDTNVVAAARPDDGGSDNDEVTEASQWKPSAYQRNSFAPRASKQSSLRLKLLSQTVVERVAWIKENGTKSWKKPYSPVPIVPKKRRRQLNDCQQPRSSDYGGIGLARESLWIPLDDPSWQPRLEEEFAEHVPGFFGKQRTKAMKKQLDGKMLWRQLAAEKLGKGANAKQQPPGNCKINGKKLSAMSPDERVEAMIRAGMI